MTNKTKWKIGVCFAFVFFFFVTLIWAVKEAEIKSKPKEKILSPEQILKIENVELKYQLALSQVEQAQTNKNIILNSMCGEMGLKNCKWDLGNKKVTGD